MTKSLTAAERFRVAGILWLPGAAMALVYAAIKGMGMATPWVALLFGLGQIFAVTPLVLRWLVRTDQGTLRLTVHHLGTDTRDRRLGYHECLCMAWLLQCRAIVAMVPILVLAVLVGLAMAWLGNRPFPEPAAWEAECGDSLLRWAVLYFWAAEAMIAKRYAQFRLRPVREPRSETRAIAWPQTAGGIQ